MLEDYTKHFIDFSTQILIWFIERNAGKNPSNFVNDVTVQH